MLGTCCRCWAHGTAPGLPRPSPALAVSLCAASSSRRCAGQQWPAGAAIRTAPQGPCLPAWLHGCSTLPPRTDGLCSPGLCLPVAGCVCGARLPCKMAAAQLAAPRSSHKNPGVTERDLPRASPCCHRLPVGPAKRHWESLHGTVHTDGVGSLCPGKGSRGLAGNPSRAFSLAGATKRQGAFAQSRAVSVC